MDDKPSNNQEPPIEWPVVGQNNKATDIARQQLDEIYSVHPTKVKPTASEQAKPLANNTVNPSTNQRPTSRKRAKDLQQYHSAWQNYYQEYYKRYYNTAYKQAEQDNHIITGGEELDTSADKQAAKELKAKIQNEIKVRAKKIKKSNHFKPILSALLVGLVFLFINYNQVVLGAAKQYLSPSVTSNTPVIITPSVSDKVGPEPKIIIPKIGVEAPVIYGMTSYDETKVDTALERGTLHYGNAALPGQKGNTVILGHSSNNVFSAGDFKYVFVNLDKVDKGDTIFVNYKGTRYTYKVTVAHKVVSPSDVSVLNQTAKPTLTLITCTPVGTNINRLIVRAEQISPDPAKGKAPSPDSQSEPQSLPATTKGLVGKFF